MNVMDRKSTTATDDRSTLLRRRKMHNAVELRRRQRMTSLFKQLAHELGLGQLDRASSMSYFMSYVIHCTTSTTTHMGPHAGFRSTLRSQQLL
jgi:hypothetical protein